MSRMLSALRQLENRAESFAPPESPFPLAGDEVSLVPVAANSDLASLAVEEPPAGETPPAFDPAPAADDAPLVVQTPRVADETPADPSDWMPTLVVPSGKTPAEQDAAHSPHLGEPPLGNLGGLAALLSRPPVEEEQKSAPIEELEPVSAKSPSESRTLKLRAGDDRGQSLTPLEARLKRNSVQDPLADQMRAFCQKVVQQFSGIQPATVLFVGVDAGDHSSVVAAHLASLLAEQKQGDVLLIDADVARRGLSAGFGHDSQRGLAELLGDSLTDGQSPIHPTLTPELSVLPCGRGAFPPATQLETRIPLLLSGLTERWPWIVVQGGAADSALTAAFAGACQGSYLLVRLGQTAPTEAADALATLNAAGACILGCVATNAP